MLNSSSKICQYFNKGIGCRFGRNCRFAHVKYKEPISDKHNDGSPVKGQISEELVGGLNISKIRNQQSNQHEEVNNDRVDNLKSVRDKICFSFQKYRRCRFGDSCNYSHSNPDLTSKLPFSESKNDQERKNYKQYDFRKDHRAERKGRKLCQYYQAGNCWKGDKCRFDHPISQPSVDTVDILLNADLQKENEDQKAPGRKHFHPRKNATVSVHRRVEIKRADATDEDILKLNKTEREQLKRRLSTNDLEVIAESDTDGCYRFMFASTDPDWPYDVKDFIIEVYISEDYPIKMFEVSLPVDQDLPETVRRHVEVSLMDWTKKKQEEMEKKGILSLVFRSFLNWLDKNLENLVTEGLRQLKKELTARAAGFEFIPAHQLQQKQREKQQSLSEDSQDREDEESESDDEDQFDPRYAPRPLIYRKSNDEEVYAGPCRQDSDHEADIVETAMAKTDRKEVDQRKGTEMKLRSLQLRENAATITFHKVKVIIQCERCKNKTDISMLAGNPCLVPCSKCNNPQIVKFRSAIMHQFSSIMGYLDLDGCTAFDLILQDSEFKLGCFSCNKEMKGKNMSPGQFSDNWCMSCHSKMRVIGETVKFSVLEPSSLSIEKENIHNIEVKKPRKLLKDPAIQLGNPLPYDGTCKHYKKSFRWFRFPCCGMAYPCDICHEEKEDHEMVFANRMICGHCSKEQPFSLDKPCSGCSLLMTKARSAHWEGGKGCRDKVKMSRNDPQKYMGQNKTISKKAQEKSKPKEKKTKLRHSSN